eukprot:403354914
MISSKCFHKVCSQCFHSKLKRDEIKNLVCHQCHEVTPQGKYKEDPEINLFLKQIDNDLPIYCDNHPIMTCDILCLQCDILTCKKCAKTHHQDHLQKPDKIVPKTLKDYLQHATLLLKQQIKSIETLISQINYARVYDYEFKCSEFMKLYNDVKKVISTLTFNKDDLWKIDFSKCQLVQNPQPQKAEIVRQKFVNERVLQNNQSKGYLEFIKLVNIELQREQQSLLKTARIYNYGKSSFELKNICSQEARMDLKPELFMRNVMVKDLQYVSYLANSVKHLEVTLLFLGAALEDTLLIVMRLFSNQTRKQFIDSTNIAIVQLRMILIIFASLDV